MYKLKINEQEFHIKTEWCDFTLQDLLNFSEVYVKHQTLLDRWINTEQETELTDAESLVEVPNVLREFIKVSSDLGDIVDNLSTASVYDVFFKLLVTMYRTIKFKSIDYEPKQIESFEHVNNTYVFPKYLTTKQVAESIDIENAAMSNANAIERLNETERYKKPLSEIAKGDWDKLSYVAAIMFGISDEHILELNEQFQTCTLDKLLECFFYISRLRDQSYIDVLTSLEKQNIEIQIVIPDKKPSK